MKILLLFVVTSPWHIFAVTGAPFSSYDSMDEMLVPESKVIDFDNLTESERVDLIRDQINITAVKLQQQLLRAAAAQKNMQRGGAPMAIKQSATEPNISSHVQNRKVIEEHIIGNIKHNIESNLMRNDTFGHMGATHEMAFSAVCDLPKHTNQSFWDDDYTWNLFFRLPHSKPYTSVSSAVLRLYMNGGSNSTEGWNRRESDNCKDPAEQMIRVTASVYWRKKSKDNSSTERKKRICSSITITRNFRGWITLDTLLAVKLWDKPNRNFGIAIDVQDQDDNTLSASRFFQPTDCSEASKSNATAAVLPWNFFRNSLAWSSDEMDDVPHVPRIDVAMHKTYTQHHYFTSSHHPHHRLFRPKHHYGGASYNVRYRLDGAPTGSSSSSTASGNSYETEEVEIKQHPSVHSQHSLTKPHKKRHLNHHRHALVNSAESEEDYSLSASLEERKL
ncbi:protein anachronism [Topomyia yanbarensis]|uniref:protein anachronism n=1 Tax=Topomyia yanbarensis TaxID=2498891 RepID=UPI00273C6087|nr:protein anachronism [Topomyia yanbarensis]